MYYSSRIKSTVDYYIESAQKNYLPLAIQHLNMSYFII